MSVSLDQILLALVFLVFSALIVLHDNPSAPPETATTASNLHDEKQPSDPNPIVNQCIDHHESCPQWSDLGFCQKNHTDMLRTCPISCDSCDDQDWNEETPGCPHKYPTCEQCTDTLHQCSHWKSSGECLRHPGYMVINCAKSCKYCHLQSNYTLRCPMNKEYMRQTRVLPNPNDLHKMFENIVSHYNMHKNESEDDGTVEWELEILSSNPWVLRFDNFFTETEANGIINAAGTFERSTDVGKKDKTGHFAKVTSTSRTSKNAWCHERCWNHPSVQKVMKRVEDLLNISTDNSEHLQILEYTEGQFYKTHHDYIGNQLQMSCGPRILTWFMYLSDVEEGGGTFFPRLNLMNEPKLGRVLFWPSVLNQDVTQMDGRTYHEAQPVVKGVKYGANSWFHLYNFQEPNLWTCTG